MSLNWPSTTLGYLAVPLASFAGSLLAVFLVFRLARVGRTLPVTNLILAGVAVSSFATALSSFMMVNAGGELRRAFVWMLGGSTLSGWKPVLGMLPYALLGLGVLLTLSYKLNILQLGDEQAQQLGIRVASVRTQIILAATLATAAAVAFSGIIGFVGTDHPAHHPPHLGRGHAPHAAAFHAVRRRFSGDRGRAGARDHGAPGTAGGHRHRAVRRALLFIHHAPIQRKKLVKPMLMRAAIQSAGYETEPVLRDIRFELPPGQLMAVIGPNGCGKTTLIRAISGVLPNVQGECHINGTDLLQSDETARARLLAVVPQSTYIPPAFTVEEVVLMGRTPHLNWLGALSARDTEIAHEAMRLTDVEGFAGRWCSQLSAGERQRVILARALAQDTPMLMMDEPTSHLDLRYQIEFMEITKNLASRQDKTIL